MSNKALQNAQINVNDEFYTFYDDIANEMEHYTTFLQGKRIYCPCDTLESNFLKYFVNNFSRLQLREVAASALGRPCYLYKWEEGYSEMHQYMLDDTNGDFFDPVMKEVRDQYDLIITNPPFSRLKEIIVMLLNEEKDFILVGNINVLKGLMIFPLIKEEKITTGYTYPKNFLQPDGTIKKFGNILWITNLSIIKPQTNLKLTKKYNPVDYPKYENYDAINVDRLKDIPIDYDGYMGVPITYLTHQLPEFKIIGSSRRDIHHEVPYTLFSNDHGGNGIVNGKLKYERIFIKRRTPYNDNER